jgi:hypothetical protein
MFELPSVSPEATQTLVLFAILALVFILLDA